MASKRGVKRKQCAGKVPRTQESAMREATRMRRTKTGQAFDAYLCKVCGNWHVGHRPKKVRQAIAARRSIEQNKGRQ